MPLGAILGAVGSIAGGLIGKSSASKQAKASAKLQKEFAQKGIQWRVEDANKAGIHPLYAMNASLPSSPGIPIMEDALGSSIQRAGQSLSNIPSARRKSAQQASVLAAQTANVRSQSLSNMAQANYYNAMAANIANPQPPAAPQQNDQGALNTAGPEVTYKKSNYTKGTPNLYVKVWDNLAKKMSYFVNPDIGIENPESLGAYYYGKSHQMQGVAPNQPPTPSGDIRLSP